MKTEMLSKSHGCGGGGVQDLVSDDAEAIEAAWGAQVDARGEEITNASNQNDLCERIGSLNIDEEGAPRKGKGEEQGEQHQK